MAPVENGNFSFLKTKELAKAMARLERKGMAHLFWFLRPSDAAHVFG